MKNLLFAFYICAVSALLFACSSAKEDGASVLMGVVLPLSLEADSHYAEGIKRAMEMSAAEVNASGGVRGKQLKIVFADTGKDSFETSKAVEKLLNSGVKYLHFGFTNQVVGELAELGEREGILVNYLCGYIPATSVNKNSVRIFVNGVQEAELMRTAVAKEDADDLHAVILKSDDFHGKSAGDYVQFEIKQRSSKIFMDVYSRGEKNFDIFASQINRLNAPYFFNYGYGAETKPILDALIKSGYRGRFISNCGFDAPALPKSSNVRAYRVFAKFSLGKIGTKESADFVKNYEKTHAGKPAWYAAYGYDAVKIFADAISASDGTPKGAREYMLQKTFDGAIGKITFDKSGDSKSELELVEN